MIEDIKFYTEKLTPQMYTGPIQSNELILREDYLVADGIIRLPKGTIGIISNIPSLSHLVHWQIHYNFWDIVYIQLKNVASYVSIYLFNFIQPLVV
jgi:hypothetical protein